MASHAIEGLTETQPQPEKFEVLNKPDPEVITDLTGENSKKPQPKMF